MRTELERAWVPGMIACDYGLRRPAPGCVPGELVILLHGYRQSGAYLLRKFEASCAADAVVLAPSAPFPLPERREDGTDRVGYSWYFYDRKRDDYFIDMRVGVEMVRNLVSQLGLDSLPIRIVGFSQGGYLAPFLASSLHSVLQVVGVASEFLAEELRQSGVVWPPSYRVDAVHGTDDEIVSLVSARQSYLKGKEMGAIGEFIELSGVGHRIVPLMQETLRELLKRKGSLA